RNRDPEGGRGRAAEFHVAIAGPVPHFRLDRIDRVFGQRRLARGGILAGANGPRVTGSGLRDPRSGTGSSPLLLRDGVLPSRAVVHARRLLFVLAPERRAQGPDGR